MSNDQDSTAAKAEQRKNAWKHETPAIVVARGGKEIEVVYRDSSKEKVLVRLPPACLVEEYFALQPHLSAFVDFVCGKDEGWANLLSDDSLIECYEAGIAINDPRFARFWEMLLKAGAKGKAMQEKASGLTSGLPAR